MNTLEEYGKLFSDLGLTEMSVKNGEFELVLKKEVPSAKTLQKKAKKKML